MAPTTDDDIRAAWKTLTSRGMIALDWKGLLPEVAVNADLLTILLGGDAPMVPPDRLPYAAEDGWTAGHRAFRDWLLSELAAAGCSIRTLSPDGMAQVTTEHLVRKGWTIQPPPEVSTGTGGGPS